MAKFQLQNFATKKQINNIFLYICTAMKNLIHTHHHFTDLPK
ncbi:hypothetical protein NIASO_06270 [Niabella soli DSM 19437]|uniref:Uncharacterized protein n=1 Tax=Niabella soli DSM 19437 TaxID=929713 RepID=W0F2V5_9BACT|nr:hypothetical protein NIASO_06270 [Niabella soli DSM 19437]